MNDVIWTKGFRLETRRRKGAFLVVNFQPLALGAVVRVRTYGVNPDC